MAVAKNIALKILLLELLCYVPVAIIAGNVLPPVGGLKIHWIFIGLTFVIAFLLVTLNNRAAGLLTLIFAFVGLQLITAIKFSLPAFIDFISGPIVFIAVVNVMTEDIDLRRLARIRKRLLLFLSLPIIIALLQYIKILPLEFMNARYVNVTLYGTEILERVNGFLYHGIELVVIIFFFFACIIIGRSGLKVYIILVVMVLAQYITIIKAGIIAAMLFAAFYGYLIDRQFRSFKSIVVGIIVLLGFSFVYTLIPDLENKHLEFDPNRFRFEDQLFTGRGYIWNVYIDGLRDFDLLQIIVGGGFGSAPTIFEANAIGVVNWSPGTHNVLLELLVNGGLFAVFLMYMIHLKQYKKVISVFQEPTTVIKRYYLAILVIPLLTIGLTAPITSMFVYWCGLSAVVLTFKVKFG